MYFILERPVKRYISCVLIKTLQKYVSVVSAAVRFKVVVLLLFIYKVSEYDQEMPQSHTVDQPMAS